MNNKSTVICPKCKEKQALKTSVVINGFSHKEPTFNNIPINISENDKTKMNCCAYCNTSFFGSYEEQIVD